MTNAPTAKDFELCPWREGIAKSEEKDCQQYFFQYEHSQSEAKEKGNEACESVFTLLMAVCSMMLDSGSRSAPFKPFVVFADRRSAIPDDLTEDQLTFLREVFPTIEDPELRARFADLVWVRNRDFPAALAAIEAYVGSGKRLAKPNTWLQASERFERAINLAAALRSRDEFSNVVGAIEECLDQPAAPGLAWLPERLMQILLDQKQGDPQKYSRLAETLARGAEGSGRWREARHYWRIAGRWYFLTESPELQRATELAAAEAYVSEAKDGSPMVQMVLLNKAIEAFARILGTEARQSELKTMALESQRGVTREMKTVSVSVDIPEMPEHMQKVRDSVSGKALPDALRTLAGLAQCESRATLQTNAEESMRQHPLRHLVSSYTLGDNGKVVDRPPTAGANEDNERAAALLVEMYRQAALLRQIRAFGTIEPAREQILLEHHPRLADVEELIVDNLIVPRGREVLIARGLLAGLNGDFLVSAHLLIPQLEHALRCVLERLGQPTFRVDARDGRQYEYDLNNVLYYKPIGDFLGEDLVFDLRGLLVEPCSTNLRNRIAHGLMADEDFSSQSLTYLWCFLLSLYLIPIQSSLGPSSEPKQ